VDRLVELFSFHFVFQHSKKVLRALGGLAVNSDAETWMPASATP
jgi:hypothetical protein